MGTSSYDGIGRRVWRLYFFTDASKQGDGRTGIGITDGRQFRSTERISELIQISNAELLAVLKAVLAAESTQCGKFLILTDSLNSFERIVNGTEDSYLVHLIRE